LLGFEDPSVRLLRFFPLSIVSAILDGTDCEAKWKILGCEVLPQEML
jgi:hypothetical protein